MDYVIHRSAERSPERSPELTSRAHAEGSRRSLAAYEATEEQRTVATERARATVTHMKNDGQKEFPRYIAVDTEPDERNKGKASVMLWDTQTEEIIGNNVYDVEEPPKLGDIAMWETFSAQYVGVDTTL